MTVSVPTAAARTCSGGTPARPRLWVSPLLLLGPLLGAISVLCPPAHAQNVLASYSLTGNVTAGTGSYDYRYTRHSRSTGGRGSHAYIYYTWDPYLDQSTNPQLPMQFGLQQQVTSSGTFYGPAYSATAKATSSLANTPNQAVLTVNYSAATTVTTALAAHQSVTVTAQPGSTFTFTVPSESDITVSTVGDSGGVFRLFGYGSGVLLGPLSGTSGPISLDTPLAPGTYWVTDSLTYTSGTDTQLGTSTHLGTTATSWGFTLTITPTGSGSGGGGGGDAGGGGD